MADAKCTRPAKVTASKQKKGQVKTPAAARDIPPPLVARKSPVEQAYYDTAQTLFVERGMSLRQIMERRLVPVAFSTLRRWYRKGNWEKLRELKSAGPQSLLPDLERAVRKMVEEMRVQLDKGKTPDAKWWDGLQKAISALEKLTGDAYFPQHFTRTLELLASYCQSTGKTELLGQLQAIFEPFTVFALKPR